MLETDQKPSVLELERCWNRLCLLKPFHTVWWSLNHQTKLDCQIGSLMQELSVLLQVPLESYYVCMSFRHSKDFSNRVLDIVRIKPSPNYLYVNYVFMQDLIFAHNKSVSSGWSERTRLPRKKNARRHILFVDVRCERTILCCINYY